MSARDHVAQSPSRVDRWIVSVFVVAIALPLIVTLFRLGRTTTDDPKQGLAPWPQPVTTWTHLERWPTRFRHWFQDHYAFRRELIRAHGTAMLRVAGISPSTTVLLGRDGWWFYADDGAMDDVLSTEPMPAEATERWATTLQDTERWLRERGIAYLFLIAPDKHAIYPEFLPATVRPIGPWRGDAFARMMEERIGETFLPIADVLRRAKIDGAGHGAVPEERLYHQTDTHWNGRGTVVAFDAIDAWMRRRGLHREPPVRVTPVAVDAAGQDLPRMLGLETLVAERVYDFAPMDARRARVVEPAGATMTSEEARLVTEHPDPSLPRIVVFRDSFMSSLVPYLAERCRRCVFVWQKDVDPQIVLQEQPDLVIQELVGRRLQTYLPYNAFRP